jgi:VWFA-related protein
MPAPSEAFAGNVLPARLRRPLLLKFGFELFVVGSICVLSFSQSVCAQEIDADDVVKMRTDIVTVPVSVVDSRGHRVVGLQQDNFIVSTEGRPQRVEFFVTGMARVALVFLLDASGSARSYLSDQRDAALSLVSRFGPQSEVAVVRFSNTTTVTAKISKDIQEASRGFSFPANSGRHTAIFDGAISALQLLGRRRSDPTERRIVILTSDGLDTGSKARASDVIAKARSENVSFYIIHFPLFTPRDGRLKARPTASGFRNLAEKTGGQYFVATDAASSLAGRSQIDLSAIFKAIAEDLVGQYLLGFYPEAALRDGHLHRVDVRLTKTAHNLRSKILRDEFILAN